MNTSIPLRDLKSGLFPHLIYPRKENGSIDWRALINPAHIVFNSKNERIAKEIEQAYGGPAKSLVYADVAAKQNVDDKHILVLLAGWRELAELRGFTSSIPTSISAAPGIVAATHVIKWIPNEEDPDGKETGATADATMENTGGFGYLGAMAGNRAFVRAVRQGLGINVLAYDEIATKDEAPQEAGHSSSSTSALYQPGPVPTLVKTCNERGFTFEAVKKSAVTRYISQDKWKKDETGNPVPPFTADPSSWTKFEDIPARDCLRLIEAIKEGKRGAK